MEPDYSQYSKQDLEEALATIDRARFPERVKAIEEALQAYAALPEQSEAEDEILLPEPKTAEQQQRDALGKFAMLAGGALIGAMMLPAYFYSFLLAGDAVSPFKWAAWIIGIIVLIWSFGYFSHPNQLRKANEDLLAKGKKPMKVNSARRVAGIIIVPLVMALMAGFGVFRGLPVALHLYVLDTQYSAITVTVAKLNYRYRKKHCNGKVYLMEYEEQLFDYVCQVIDRSTWESLEAGQQLRLEGSQSALGFLATHGQAVKDR